MIKVDLAQVKGINSIVRSSAEKGSNVLPLLKSLPKAAMINGLTSDKVQLSPKEKANIEYEFCAWFECVM